MNFERFKSILLIILVISSIVLTGNKWFDEKLWPGGYNFFSDVKNFFTGTEEKTVVFNPNEEILRPAKIIVNNSGNHVLFTKSSAEYNGLFEEIKNILDESIPTKEFENANIDEWNNQLRSKSCYFTYPVTYDSDYFSSQLSDKYSGTFRAFKEFVVTPDVRLPSVMYLYIKDAYSDSIQKIRLDYESNKIKNHIEAAGEFNEILNYYSFELNFDLDNDDSVKQPVIINPDVLLNISGHSISDIMENNLFSDISENEQLCNDIMSVFGYNTSNIRKYVEHDNSIVFVENYSTLKLHTNGILDYKSVDSGKGIKLDTTSKNACMNSCISFVNKVTEHMNMPEPMYYEISSNIGEVTSKTFTMTFDYYFNDNQIIIPENLYSVDHAITIEVTDGKITSYRQICKTFEPSGEYIECSSAIEAIDKINPESHSGGTISDIALAYSYDKKSGNWNPMWYIENSNGEFSTISSGRDYTGMVQY